MVSADGRWVVFGTSKGGSEDLTLKVVDVATGALLSDRLEHMNSPDVSWIPGHNRFFYTRYPHFHEGDATNRYKDPQVRIHTLGERTEEDVLVVGANEGDSPELGPNDIPAIAAVPGSDVAVLSIYRGTGSDLALFVRPLSATTAKGHWRQLTTFDDAVFDWALVGRQLYAVARRDAPLGKVLRFDAKHEGSPELFLESGLRNIVGISASRTALWVRDEDLTGSGVRRIDLKTRAAATVHVPFDAVTSIATSSTSDEVALVGEGWADSPRWLSVDPNLEVHQLFSDQTTVSVPGSHVAHLEVTSRDGTLVPLTLISKGDIPRDGSTPLLLLGYGAFEVSISPRFGSSRSLWVEHGGAIAVAHVRGGGERGREWHLAGRREKKQNSVDDFLAVADYLVRERYTSSSSMGAAGNSAGGLLVGMAMVQRPELFRAVYIESGVVNLQRLLNFEAGPLSTEEWGLPDSPEGLRSILQMDVYQHVANDVKYPAVLAAVGVNDVRVPYWQSAKLIAKLHSDPANTRPALLRVDSDAGHSSSTLLTQADTSADMLGFFLWQLKNDLTREWQRR